ncbi:membrane protein DedA with SNARE-associated domain [Neobacillus sp. B4I6]|jgi:membrane protein DedA with SNARE-associated domain|uniref:DedA family protein n=1 Tax=Neobacillus sp. B4I6 TaxID=3373925 RepID=UPI003D230170
MESLIKELIEQYGYGAIFLLIALENVFPPIPSEVILTFGGYMTYGTNLSITGVILSSTFGSITGAIFLYGLGLLLDVKRLETIIEKYGRVLRLTKEDIYRADTWFDKYGIWTVLFCRLIPLIRSLISIPAGMSNMNFWLFLIFSTTGTLVWNTILVHLGARLGADWEHITNLMDRFSNIVYILIIILILIVIGWYIKKRRERKDM